MRVKGVKYKNTVRFVDWLNEDKGMPIHSYYWSMDYGAGGGGCTLIYVKNKLLKSIVEIGSINGNEIYLKYPEYQEDVLSAVSKYELETGNKNIEVTIDNSEKTDTPIESNIFTNIDWLVYIAIASAVIGIGFGTR